MPDRQDLSVEEILEKDIDEVVTWAWNLYDQQVFEEILQKLAEIACDDSKNDAVRIKALCAMRALPPHDCHSKNPHLKPKLAGQLLSKLLNLGGNLFEAHGSDKVLDGKGELLNHTVWTARHLVSDLNRDLNAQADP